MTEYVYRKERQVEVLNRVVENVLCQILGQDATQIVYNYLESRHSLKKYQIAENFDSFNHALEQYFGSGAAVLERAITQSFELAMQDGNESIDLVGYRKIAKLA